MRRPSISGSTCAGLSCPWEPSRVSLTSSQEAIAPGGSRARSAAPGTGLPPADQPVSQHGRPGARARCSASAPSPWPRASTMWPCRLEHALCPRTGLWRCVATIGRRSDICRRHCGHALRTTCSRSSSMLWALVPRVPGPIWPRAWRSWARLRRDSSMAARPSRSPRPRMTSSV